MTAFALDCTAATRIDAHGYGYEWRGGKMRKAHRVIYEEEFGEIGEDHQIHHLCGNRFCVEPDHLISVTPSQHVVLFGAKPRIKTHCSRGHEIAIVGRYATGTCRQCAKDTAAARR